MKPAHQKQTLYLDSLLFIFFPSDLGDGLSHCFPKESNSIAEPVIVQGQKGRKECFHLLFPILLLDLTPTEVSKRSYSSNNCLPRLIINF